MAQTQPKLYEYKVCPFCWKTKAILGYKRIPYESVEVHPLNKKEIRFSKEYRKVPIYIDREGRQVNDSTPIMRHIDQEFPERPVFAKEGKEQQEEEKWLNWADQVLVRALPPLIYRKLSDSITAFDYITKVEKFNWWEQRTIKYSGAFVMTLVAKKSAKSQGIKNPETHLQKCLHDWAKALGKHEFLGRNKPNGADLAVYGVLKSVETLPAFEWVRKNASVREWFYRVENLALGGASVN